MRAFSRESERGQTSSVGDDVEMFLRSGVRQQTQEGLRTELAITAEKDNMFFCSKTEGPSQGEKKPKEETSRRKKTRKVRVGTQQCWDNLISDQRRRVWSWVKRMRKL